jgi:hypothetical protein
MENLVKNNNKRLEFGKKSRLIVEQLFDEEKVNSKQIKLFNNLVLNGD